MNHIFSTADKDMNVNVTLTAEWTTEVAKPGFFNTNTR